MSFLAETYQFVVVDCPPGLTESTLACIAQSDYVAIVMTAELPSVRNAVRYLEHLVQRGFSPEKIHLILNRYSKKGPLSDEQIERALGRAISLRVPNSYHEVIRAINAGSPIESGKSDFSGAIQQWAKQIGVEVRETAKAASASRGVMSLFGK